MIKNYNGLSIDSLYYYAKEDNINEYNIILKKHNKDNELIFIVFLNGELEMKNYIYNIINGKVFYSPKIGKYITYNEKTKMYVKEDFSEVVPLIAEIIANEFKNDLKCFNDKLSNEASEEKRESIKKIIEAMEKRKRAAAKISYVRDIVEYLARDIKNDEILDKFDSKEDLISFNN